MRHERQRERRTASRRRPSAVAAAVALVAFAGLPGSGGASPASSPPLQVSPPAISGRATEGQVLTASSGTWAGTTPIAFEYRWKRCTASGGGCANRSAGQTYTLGPNDVGRRLRVTVTATNADGSASATSAPTAVVAGALPVVVSPPALSGRPREGRRLSISDGTWSGSPTAFSYAWQRCDSTGSACLTVRGAKERRYVLTPGDVGRTMRGVVTATNAYGSTSAATAPSGVVTSLAGGPPVNTSPPSIVGPAREGETLRARPGVWSGARPVQYAYAWERCDALGAGCVRRPEASSAYELRFADAGHTLRVAVTGSNPAGSSTVYSRPTAVVERTLPPGALQLADGTVSIPAESVTPPERLAIARSSFRPRPVSSHAAFRARFRVSDTRGYAVRGALVLVVGVPFGRILPVPERAAGRDGWVRFRLEPTARLRRAGGALYLLVQVRRPDERPGTGVSNRQLFVVPTAPPAAMP